MESDIQTVLLSDLKSFVKRSLNDLDSVVQMSELYLSYKWFLCLHDKRELFAGTPAYRHNDKCQKMVCKLRSVVVAEN